MGSKRCRCSSKTPVGLAELTDILDNPRERGQVSLAGGIRQLSGQVVREFLPRTSRWQRARHTIRWWSLPGCSLTRKANAIGKASGPGTAKTKALGIWHEPDARVVAIGRLPTARAVRSSRRDERGRDPQRTRRSDLLRFHECLVALHCQWRRGAQGASTRS